MTHRYLERTGWWLLIVAILVVGHGIVLYHVTLRFTGSVLLGIICLLLLKHVGLFSSIYAVLKRSSRG